MNKSPTAVELDGVYDWFTNSTVRINTYDTPWSAFIERIDNRGIDVWNYAAFLIWYDEYTTGEQYSVLRKYNYVRSESSIDRYQKWHRARQDSLPKLVQYQIEHLRDKIRLLGGPRRLLLAKHVDANSMVRFELLAECKEILTPEEYSEIFMKLKTRVYEMYLCFPMYEHLTPKAWDLVKDLKDVRRI